MFSVVVAVQKLFNMLGVLARVDVLRAKKFSLGIPQ
jgi:hypothetical protein